MAVNFFTDAYTRKVTFDWRLPERNATNVFNKLLITGNSGKVDITAQMPAQTGPFGTFTQEVIASAVPTYSFPVYSSYGEIMYPGPQVAAA